MRSHAPNPGGPGAGTTERAERSPPRDDDHRRTRRWCLTAVGGSLTAGLAGCQLRQRDGDGAATDGPDGDTTPTTMPPGSTYSIQVRNFLTAGDLEPVEGLAADAPATVSVEAQANYDDRDDEILFERSVDLAPETSRTFADAFTTDADGPEYVVRARLEPLVEPDSSTTGMVHTGAHRFGPGGFQAPRFDTFLVGVRTSSPNEDALQEYLTVEPGTPEEGSK